jgi:flagellar biosynthesis protein FlhG
VGDAPTLKLVRTAPEEEAARRPVAAAPRRRARRVISIGGGKGGIGKSLISANLGIELARRGKKVILVDADLGGANLHTTLGIDVPRRTLSDYIERRSSASRTR